MTQHTSIVYVPNAHNKVYLPNDNTTISHIGSICMFINKFVSNVLYLPDFRVNLLSVSKITKKLNCLVVFYPDFCVFQDLSNGQVKRIDKEQHGLYILKGGPTQAPKKLVNSSRSLSEKQLVKSNVVPVSSNSVEIWQKRLGHAPLDIIKRHGFLRSLEEQDQSHCIVCPVAKHTKKPFPLNSIVSSFIFEFAKL